MMADQDEKKHAGTVDPGLNPGPVGPAPDLSCTADRDQPPVEDTYTAADGARLGCICYRGPHRASGTALVYFHGIESHAAWFAAPARLLAGRGYDVFCLDRRGSGINRENRGFTSGHIDSYHTLLSDAHCFIEPLRARYERVCLIGLSWGAKLALAYALTHPNHAAGVILITPGLRVLVDLGTLTKLRVLVASSSAPKTLISLPLTPEMFTSDPTHQEYIRDDPLRLTQVTARFLMQSHRLDAYVTHRMQRGRMRILLFLAGKDRIIDNDGVLLTLRRSEEGTLDVHIYDDQTHSIQFDAPQRLVDDIDRWLRALTRES